MKAFAARCLDEIRQPEVVQLLLDFEGSAADVVDIQPLVGIEIEDDLVRVLDLVDGCAPDIPRSPAWATRS